MENTREQQGFILQNSREIAELNGVLYEYEHQKTGAKLAWLKRPEVNKTFMAAFETLPEDDTGVFHILEHSVLCGSAKYPVKEPFVELLKSSMNTFLNAMTYPDKTVYPVSSRNPADFMNLVKVYADAVFAPAIYQNPHIFRQEGWHYEIRQPEDTPVYKGVVFNEMKGAMSSVDERIEAEMNRLLFPESCYRFNSGGDPEHIPDLSYEQFIATHKRFYHPSNALIFLDGDLDLEPVLELLNRDYLSKFNRQERDFHLAMQPPVKSVSAERYYQLAPGEEPAGKTHVATGQIVGTWQDKEKLLAIEILCDYLAGSNDAPLKKAILEKGLGQDLRLYLADYIAQPWVRWEVRNTEKEKCAEITAVIRETMETLIAKGLERPDLAASLNHLEFQYLEPTEPRGLILGLWACQSWLHGGDPALYMTWRDTFQSLREKLDTRYFADLAAELFLDDSHKVTLYMLPSTTIGAEQQQREDRCLADAKASWDSETLNRLLAENQALDAWQQTEDTPENLATLPCLTLAEVSREPEPMDTQVTEMDGVTILSRTSRAPGVTYLNLYFSLGLLPLDKLPYASLLSSLLGKLPTSQHTVRELRREIKTRLGSLTFTVDAFNYPGETVTCRPVLSVQCSLLDSQIHEGLELVWEILLETDFSQDRKIQELLAQMVTARQEALVSRGHVIAMNRVVSHHSAAKAAMEATSGYMYYRWLQSFQKDYETHKKAFDDLALSHRIFHKSGLTVSISGTMPQAELKGLLETFPSAKKGLETVAYPLQDAAREGIEIPASVSFSALGRAVPSITGSMKVLANILSFDYLWNAVRVQGGAYGTGFTVGDSGIAYFHSFRDPDALRSLGIYQKAADYIRAFCQDSEELDKQIIGAAAEPLFSPKSHALVADGNYFRGLDTAARKRLREEILDTKPEDLLALCGLLEEIVAAGSICVVGSRKALDACGNLSIVEW